MSIKKANTQLGGETHVLGDRTFAAITAVEGVQLSASSRKRLSEMNKRKLSADEQRSEVIRAYADAKVRR
jgi:hypothetical protein